MDHKDSDITPVIAQICIDMARGLIVSGAGTARVEETVRFIGESCGVTIDSQVTPTSIVVSVGDENPAIRICRVRARTLDLDKMAELNQVARDLCSHQITIHAARMHIAKVLARKPIYSRFTIYLGQALCCAGFSIMLGGGSPEFIPAFIAGLLAQYLLEVLGHMPLFLCAFTSAATTTVAALVAHHFYPHFLLEPIVLAGLVPLLPGLSLANAAADLMAGELTAGLARTTEALLCAAALASGAMVGINLLHVL